MCNIKSVGSCHGCHSLTLVDFSYEQMLMLDSPAATPKDREEMASTLFEHFAIPAFYAMMQADLGVSSVLGLVVLKCNWGNLM